MVKLKDREMKIMSMLRKNSREKLTSMSRKSKIPVSTIHDRLKKYKDDIIERYTSILDFPKMGFNARAAVSIKVSKSRKKELKKKLMSHPNVNSVFKVNNGYDYWMECIFKNIRELEEFLEGLENKYKVKKDVFYIIDDLKREAFMSNPELTDIVC